MSEEPKKLESKSTLGSRLPGGRREYQPRRAGIAVLAAVLAGAAALFLNLLAEHGTGSLGYILGMGSAALIGAYIGGAFHEPSEGEYGHATEDGKPKIKVPESPEDFGKAEARENDR